MGKIQELYNTLKSAGADVGTEKEFADWFQAPGQDGYNNRKQLYDTFKSAGADVGDSYEEFASWLNLQPKAAQTVDNASKAAPTAKPTQTPQATQQPSTDVATTTPKSRLEVSTEDDRPSQSYEKTTDPVLRSTTVINPEASQEWEGYKESNPLQAQYIEKSIGADRKLPTFEQYVKADAEAQRKDPIGYAFSKSINEMSSADRAHAYLADQKAEIEKQLNDIAKKRMQDYADSNGAALGMTVQEYLNLDEDYKNLSTALEQAKKSEKVSDNARDARTGDSGFWRGVVDGLTDANAWTMGVLDIQGMMPMMRLKRKLENGEQLTDTEQALAQQMANNTAISEEYADKQGSWYNVGSIASQSLPFMLQFAMTGGGFGTLTRAGTKLGADAARKFTQNALLRNIIKHTGTAVGDIAGAAVMANTVGAANTVNDIFDRYRGTLIQTGDGRYQFAGGKGLGQSIYEGATAQTIEFYTEKLGAHLAITKKTAKALGKMGLSKLSTAMSKLGGNKTLSVLGMQDYPSEVLEEEANIILTASLVGDNKFKDLWDSKQQTDLALGMLFSVGGMQAGTTAVSGVYYGAQYQRMKHAMNKWQVRGSGVFNDNAEWARIQNSLDNADNQHIADAVNSILDNGKYTESQKRAIAGYASALVKMRGYNSALMSIVTDPKEPKRDNKLAEEMIGYNANPQQRRELYLEAYGRRKALSQFMDEEQINEIVADPEAYLASGKADAFTADQKAQIDGFAHNQIALNSTRQRIADDTDLEVANFEATVDRMSNEGNIVSGTIRNTGDDSKEKPRKEVVIIKGKVVTNDDGSVNVEQSDESLVALVDGKEQMIAPKDLADVEITSAEEQKNLERERISNEYILSQESGMNGMPINKVGNTFKYLDTDGVEHTATIVPTANGQQLPDGQLFVSIDGAEPVAMSQTPLQVGINDYDYAQLQEQKRNKGKQKPTADTTSTDQVSTPTEGVEATTDNAAQPQPQYKQGDRVSVNYGGQQYDGTITGEYNDGEKLLVEFEGPDGTRTYPFNMEDVSPIEVVAIPGQTDAATDAQIEAVEPTEEPTTEPTAPTADETAPAKAIDRIPKDESGQPLYEQSDVATAAEAVLDETEGDSDMASTVVNSMIEDKKKALDKANKAKSKGGNTISEKIASEKERKAAIDKAQSELDFWKGVADELAKRNGTTAENAAPQADTVEEAPTADEAATDAAPTTEGTGVATTTTTTTTPTADTETATDTATDEVITTTDEADKATTDSQEPSSKQTNIDKDVETQSAGGAQNGNKVLEKEPKPAEEATPAEEEPKAGEAKIDTNPTEAPVKAETPTISQDSGQVSNQDNAPYTITPTTYTNKKGKTIPMYLVTFGTELSKDEIRAGKELAKESRGWWDREKGGFMMRDEDSAKALAEALSNDDAVRDAQPVSLTDIQALNNGDVVFTEPQQPKEQPKDEEYHPIWQYSIHVDTDGYTTISRADVSGPIPIGDGRFRFSADSPEEMLDILRNPLNGMDEVLEAVGVTLENKIKTRELDRKIKKEREQKRAELRTNGVNGYKIGDKVTYTPTDGTRKAITATIHDFEEYGENRPVLDVGLAPVMYEVAEWSDIAKVEPSKTTLPDDESVVLEKPETWVGKTFYTNGMQLKCTDVSKGYATFENLTTFMGMGFDVSTVQKYMRNGEWAVVAPKINRTGNKQGDSEIEQPKQEKKRDESTKPKNEGQFGLVSDERMAELKNRLRKKLGGQMNIGIDPEILAIGLEIAVGHLDRGVKTFADFAKVMISDLGDVIRPYLKAFYNGARELPEVVENGLASDMTSYDEVQSFDVTNFDKQGIDVFATAETITRESEVAKEVEIAQERIKKTRSAKKETGKKSVTSQTQTMPDLLSGLAEEDNVKSTSNEQEVHVQPRTGTAEREGGHEPRQNESLGESKQNEDERPDAGGVVRRSGNNTKPDTAGGSRVSEPSNGKRNVKPATPEPASFSESERKNIHNNHVERGTDNAPKGTNARIEANIKAIETMQRLIESGESATPEDMAVLRKFSGWGGLGAAFKEKLGGGWGSPNPANVRLRELLSPEAYEAAQLSRNTAFYTPAPIIDAMWDIAQAMGFRGGNVLEGSAGIGKILGLMPAEMSERSNIQAVELDETTGNILKLLYPDAKVDVQGFEKTYIPNGSVDLAITNVPFGDIRVKDDTGDNDLSKKFHSIHDFCIAKNVRKLKEGGIGIFISTSGTLDSLNSAKLRTWLVNDGNSDVVGAFRLHKDTFGGAGVTSDIIVIRKRVNGRKSANAIDVSGTLPIRTVKYNTGETKRGSSEVIVKDLALDVNKYFVEHPEDMAGEMAFAFEKDDTYRATSKALYPSPSINQEQRLSEWAQQFKDMDWDKAEERESQQVVYEDLGKDVKEGSMLLDSDGNLCLAQRGKAVPINVNANKVKGHTKAECFNAYKAIKDALAAALEYQTTNSGDSGLQQRLAKLNKAYDSFVKTYGHLNKNTSISFLRSDIDYPSIAALESVSETGDKSGKRIVTYGKTDVFSRRVVEPESEPKPTTIKDGIIASIYLNGRVDVPYIAEQLNMSNSDVRQQIIESGLGFENPTTTEIEVSYEYLSGNVREKLRQAQENNIDGRYDANIKALERVIPMNIPAHLIEFTLGSSWIEPKLYEDFVKERTGLDVKLTNAGGTWVMSEPYYTDTEKNKAMGVISEICDKTILGHELIKAAITCKSIRVTKTISTGYGSNKATETIVDEEATMACANKVDEIRQDFKDWARGKMQGDPEMSERMERVYNEMFNNSVPKEIPDEFVPEHFGGSATVVNGKPFKLRPHQAKAVIRATTQPLMLAHEVGTGKTYTLISIAMEMRRLGTARKPMIVVQNATVGQFVASAKALYPNAKILTLEDADRNAEGRRNFYAKIRYNDWDMIVVPQSVFERIPDSEERQIRFIEDKVEEKMMILEKMREATNDDSDPVLRQAQRELDQLEDELNDLKLALQERNAGDKPKKDEKREAKTRQNAIVKAQEMLDRKTDDVANFDDMGIDALLIDEAHEYKHLGFATAMQRGVKGVDPSYSKKSQGVYLKTQAVLESKNGKNVVFATGTPISNTAAEIWTFMRYLMPADTMREYDIYYFDDFVRNFGNIQQMLEFATNGKYKENNRFAGYVNLPELVRIWASVADTVLTREAGGVSDKIPKMDGGKAQDIYLPQTKALRSVMKFVKAQLDDYEKMSGKQKKENSHIPLVMYGIAKAAAVDVRLVLEDAADEPNSKTNEAVRQTLRSLEDTKEYNGTVAIFADNYQNKSTGFNLYEDIRKKLIDAGVPEAQIVVMKSGMSIKKKLEIFDKVNRGEVRVIMGSTFTLGTGVNIQERLHTLIHVDAPNRPMDYTQRNGRILRQGNLHNEWGIPVRILRFGVEDSLDVTAYQRLKTKGAIADSIMEGKKMMSNSMENRVLEEEQDLFGDITAQLSGSQYALLKNQVEKEVKKLEARKKQWEADQTYVHNQKIRLKSLIKDSEERAKSNKEALAKVKVAKNDGITIDKMKFPSLDAMGDYFKSYNIKQREQQEQVRTASVYKAEAKSDLTVSVGGFDFHIHRVISKEQKRDKGQLSLSFFAKTQMTYSCPELGLEDVPVDGQYLKSALDDILENVLSGYDFREKAEYADRTAERYKGELQQVEARDGKPFEYADELKQAKEKLAEYEELMKAEMAEKEAKYAEMDTSVEAAKGVQYSDEEDGDTEEDTVKYRISTAQQRKARAERERRRMAETVGQMVEKLQLDNVDVVTDTSTLSGRKAKAKGWYDPKTGRIVVVLPNHSSAMDVAQTVLHEAVAHYGLRRLFGDHFDSFLDTVWLSAKGDVKQRILNLAQRNGWNFRTATEEYLASLAEDTEFDNMNASWWNKIKSLFSEMLDKLGLGELLPMKLSDNELRYILWRSYMNLQGKDVGIMGNAADIGKQMQLGVGNFANTANNDKAADAKPLFRDGTPVTEGATAVRKALVRDKYEQRIKSGWYQTAEAIYDSMQSVKNAMEMVYEAEGEKEPYIEDIPMYENAYIGENVLSSMNKAQADYFANTLFKAMVEEYSKLARTKEERRDLDEYMMAKHGLERNEKMAERDAQRAYDEYKAANPSGTKTLSDFLTAYRQKEYAGLVGLFAKDEQIATALDRMEYLRERLNNVTDPSERAAIRKQIAELRLSNHIRAEKLATDAVELYESENNTADLWEAVRGVTGYTLEKQLSTGLMAADTYNKIKAMYEYYIPLRGFDADVSEDVYAYLGDNGANRNETFVPVAEGRESKADNPLAYMQSMAESAIQSGNRNEMVKQRFLTFVQNHPSDLYSVSEMWLAYNEDTEEWEPVVNEEIDANDSPTTVAAKQQAFEERMANLAESEPDKFRKASQAKDIPYRVLKKKQLKEHQVMVKRNGITYIITVNGNPRLAQAINGMTNPDADISGAVGKIVEFMQKGNRTLSQLYTSRNPNFVVSNFIRDSIYSSTMLLVKESPEYLANFIANVSKYNPWKMSSMFRKWNRGEVDDADMLLFKRFMLNGGETGYTELKAMEERKNDIAKQIKNATGNNRAKLIWEWIATSLDVVGRAVENTNRFGAFVTSLDMGRDVTRAAYDAKEISVNFNRKGSGSKMMGANGQTKLGNTAAFVSGVGRSLYIFWNAAIQGTGNLFKNYRRHPLKATAMTTFWLGLGYLMSAFMMGADGDGDDDDKEKYNGYFNLSQFIRRDNLCISVGGGQYATLPLPIEFRAVYGIGELFGSVTSGKEQLTGDEIAYALFEQVSQVAPIDYSSGGMNAFIPSIVRPLVEVAQNKSWTGLPIAKETPFNKNMPEYTKHYKNTNGILVGFTEQLNHAFGGDKYTRASTEWAEVNPAKVEYLMNAYLGGFFQVVDQTIKTAETVAGTREFDPRSIPLLNRVLKSGDERTAYRKINNDFYKAKEKYGILKGRLSGYKKETLIGDEEYSQKWVNLMSEKEFEEMKVFDVFNKQLNKLYEVRKQMPEGSDEAKEIDTMSQALRIDALQAISDISNE